MNTFWTTCIVVAVIILVLFIACALAGANGHFPEDEEL